MPADPPPPRWVAQLWCVDVLARLPDLLEGTLPDAERANVAAHVAACDWCAQFGGEYAGVVRALRAGAPEAAPSEVTERLNAALADLLGP